MATFLIALVGYTAVALALCTPVLVAARRKGRVQVGNKFLFAATGIGVFCATIAYGSERLVEQCRSAGNPNCVDFGASGFQLMAVGGCAIVAWIKAVMLYQD